MMRECRKGVVRIPSNAAMLYQYGDECVGLTGGWTITRQYNDVVSKNASDITMTIQTSSVENESAVATTNLIDLTGYSRFCVLTSSAITCNRLAYCATYASSNQSCRPTYVVAIAKTHTKNDMNIHTGTWDNLLIPMDISSITGAYYLIVSHYSNYWQTGYLTFKAAWLER